MMKKVRKTYKMSDNLMIFNFDEASHFIKMEYRKGDKICQWHQHNK